MSVHSAYTNSARHPYIITYRFTCHNSTINFYFFSVIPITTSITKHRQQESLANAKLSARQPISLPKMQSSVKLRENVNLQQFKVIDLGANRKRICNFLLVISSNFGQLVTSRTVFEMSTNKAIANSLFSSPHPCLTPHSEEHPRISAYTLYIQKLYRVISLSYIFTADSMGPYLTFGVGAEHSSAEASVWAQCAKQYGSTFIQIFAVGCKRRIFTAIDCVSAVQGHPTSMILVPIEIVYATSYQSVIVMLVISCTVSEVQQLAG